MRRQIPRLVASVNALMRFFDLGSVSRWVLFAALIGIAAGLAGVGFEWMIHEAKDWMMHRPTGLQTEGLDAWDSRVWLVLAIPTAGGLLCGFLTQTFAPEAEGHGTDNVVKAFHRLRGHVRARVIFLKALTAAITIGSGGSAGKEGPVAQVGAGVGSTLADGLKLSHRDRRIFLLSGASAGIGAMFCAPLGGALFMPEVLYRKAEFEGEAIIPCIIASIFAYTTYTKLTGVEKSIPIDAETLGSLSFQPQHILLYLFLAGVCTLFGWLWVRSFYGIRDAFKAQRVVPPMLRPALGGLLLGLLAVVITPLAGADGIFHGGYGLISSAIGGSLAIDVLLVLAVAKILATSFSISSGGSGGVFAPSLAIGALLGAFVGQSAHALFPGLDVNPASFALVGMGGFFAGVAKVPIAAVIMVCEMTGSYALLAPLMLVSVIHMMLSKHWSLYEAQVPGLVNSPAHAGDFVVDVLADIKVADLLPETREPHCVHHFMTLRRVLDYVADAKESYFPVVNDDDYLVGIFSLTDLRRIYREHVVEDMVIVRDFMIEHVITAKMDDDLHVVLRRLSKNNINTIPIVEGEGSERRVLALLERNEIGRAYDRRLEELRNADSA
ncbi:MAG: chloride channel protein [Planctomycetes bacterium]|nr:chloride channel protein [Planctomycetota bacterium]MCB9905454.1 chloride channel protein [Planctomycetota bacterium]